MQLYQLQKEHFNITNKYVELEVTGLDGLKSKYLETNRIIFHVFKQFEAFYVHFKSIVLIITKLD